MQFDFIVAHFSSCSRSRSHSLIWCVRDCVCKISVGFFSLFCSLFSGLNAHVWTLHNAHTETVYSLRIWYRDKKIQIMNSFYRKQVLFVFVLVVILWCECAHARLILRLVWLWLRQTTGNNQYIPMNVMLCYNVACASEYVCMRIRIKRKPNER